MEANKNLASIEDLIETLEYLLKNDKESLLDNSIYMDNYLTLLSFLIEVSRKNDKRKKFNKIVYKNLLTFLDQS